MENLVHAPRWLVETLLRPLDLLVPWASLTIIAVVTAVVMLVVIRRTSPQARIRHARAQMAGAIFEMRLYLDHPLQLLRAQGRLFVWTVIYVGYLLPSMAVLLAPLGILYLHLEVRHGVAPLPGPTQVVMRIEVADHVVLRDLVVEPKGAVEVTGRLHAEDENALYVRLAITEKGTHTVTVHAKDAIATMDVVADPSADVVSPERRHGIAHLWAIGAQRPIAASEFRSITIQYPERESALPVPWWLYWLGLATAVAMALRNRFGVAL